MHYLLFYEAQPDYVEQRTAFRAVHLALAEEYAARGALILAGALADPIDGAVFLFQGSSPAIAEEFAQKDPYVIHGLVKSWRVRTWPTVVGKDAATPLSSAQFR
jgi:uncharacterized protein YciI